MNDLLRLCEHMDAADPIPSGDPGTLGNPLERMPEHVPYGAWFRCHACGRTGRSTCTWDCYGEFGELLTCEDCVGW